MENYLIALCDVFAAIFHVRLSDGTCELVKNDLTDLLDFSDVKNKEDLLAVLHAGLVQKADKKRLESFLVLNSVARRLGDSVSISEDVMLREYGWYRLSLYPCRREGEKTLTDVLLCLRNINEEKLASLKAQREMQKTNMVLKEALAAAHHASQVKTTFLNSMSHDIRTPMNAIIGFTSLAAAHIQNTEAVAEYLKKITIASNHLLSLINDVLDMSRIESGRTKLDEKEVSLPEVLHDLRSIIHSSIEAKQLDFYVDTQDVVHENVIADKLRLNQVLLNILGNAIKFTPSGGTISMRVIENSCPRTGYAEYEFRIKDTGIGMSQEYQQHIFEPFSREETTTVSGIQGSGLGMAITKNIVDMMNGAIAVNSELGKGTEFIVVVDLKKSSQTVSQEVVPELQGMHVLVADDDFNTCSSVSKMLTTIGMHPEWTTSGKEAVLRTRYAKESGKSFGAFIIDWLMPDMNGVEVVRRIRKEIDKDTPIIILTAYDWTGIEEEAREAGVTGFCAKPLFLSELRDVLSRPFRKPVGQEEKSEAIDVSLFEGKRLLIAEDNLINQELIEAILSEFGFILDIVGDGTEALEKMNECEAGYYDVLITDIQMPIMDGYELSRAVRALNDRDKASIPILAMTANAFDEDRRLSLAAKMDGHLTKPVDVDELLHTLKKVIFR